MASWMTSFLHRSSLICSDSLGGIEVVMQTS
nr:MAG TPA: hypothetical protein [Caudoviricetes sp.]DAW82976.1 MAG TPA: hypothetical protein [Caudoviricetes sp.]